MVAFLGAVSNTTRNFLEGHLSSFISGLVFAWFFRNDLPKRKKYQWEIDEEIEMSSKQDQEITVNYEYKENNLFIFSTPKLDEKPCSFVTIIKYKFYYPINYCKKTGTFF